MGINLTAKADLEIKQKTKQKTYNRGDSLRGSHEHPSVIIHHKPSRRLRQRRRMITQRPGIRILTPEIIVNNFNLTNADILPLTLFLSLGLVVGGGGRRAILVDVGLGSGAAGDKEERAGGDREGE